VDPGPLTLRELCWMAEGKQRNDWSHTSVILALVANCNRDPKKRAFTPDDFNPFGRKSKEQIGIDDVKAMFAQKHETKVSHGEHRRDPRRQGVR
jgi:hypothetical protein